MCLKIISTTPMQVLQKLKKILSISLVLSLFLPFINAAPANASYSMDEYGMTHDKIVRCSDGEFYITPTYSLLVDEGTDLQRLIEASEDTDTLAICPGTYRGVYNIEGKDITLLGLGSEPQDVRIDAYKTNSVFTVTNSEVNFYNFSIVNGFGYVGLHKGGGISANGATKINLEDIDLGRNETSTSGGAIALSDGSRLQAKKTKFYSNRATFGGAIKAEGESEVSLTDCTFHNNRSEIQGAAISMDGDTKLHIENTQFSENSSKEIGGVLSLGSGDVTIKNSSFSYNHTEGPGAVIQAAGTSIQSVGNKFSKNVSSASIILLIASAELDSTDDQFIKNTGTLYNGSYGSSAEFSGTQVVQNKTNLARSGLFNAGNSSLKISNAKFKKNNGVSQLIRAANESDVTIENSNFIQNKYLGTIEGGIVLFTSASTSASLTNVKMEKNSSAWSVGAIHSNDPSDHIELVNVTLTQNSASHGGAAITHTGATITAENSVFSDNITINCSGGPLLDHGLNIDSDGSCFL
jgi:hypothetical protein